MKKLTVRTPASHLGVKIITRNSASQSESKPDNPSDDGEESDNGDEDTGDSVGDPLNRGTTGLSLANNSDNLIQPLKIVRQSSLAQAS
jgi:hypothetical protein